MFCFVLQGNKSISQWKMHWPFFKEGMAAKIQLHGRYHKYDKETKWAKYKTARKKTQAYSLLEEVICFEKEREYPHYIYTKSMLPLI